MINEVFFAKYGNCKISVPPQYKVRNVKNPVVFCVDCVYGKKQNKKGRRCDEFIFFEINVNATGIYLIERKTNIIDLTKIEDQLQGGANFVADFIQKDPALDIYGFNFMPVFVSSSDVIPSRRAKLLAIEISLIDNIKHIHYIKNKEKLPKLSI